MKQPKRILFIAPPLHGHTNQLIVLAEELTKRAYQVAFATSLPFRERVIEKQIHFLLWDPDSEIKDPEIVRQGREIWTTVSHLQSTLRGERLIFKVVVNTYLAMYRTLEPIFEKYQPDLMICDRAVLPAMEIAIKRDVPYIVFAQFLGNLAKTPRHLPQYGTPYLHEMTRPQRLLNSIYPELTLAHYLPGFIRLQRYRSRIGARIPLSDLYRKTLILVSTTFGIEIPRKLPPNLRMVGPIFPEKLPSLGEFEINWLNQTPETVPYIFMSFGTLAVLEERQLRALIEGLTSNSFYVVWALRQEQYALLPGLPANITIGSFLPQMTLLAHPKIKVFISHCGMNGISESLYFGKPILALPIFGDQHYNAARVKDTGVGERLNKLNFTAGEVHHKLTQMLHNPSYRAKAAELGCGIKEAKGRETAANLVEDFLLNGFET